MSGHSPFSHEPFLTIRWHVAWQWYGMWHGMGSSCTSSPLMWTLLFVPHNHNQPPCCNNSLPYASLLLCPKCQPSERWPVLALLVFLCVSLSHSDFICILKKKTDEVKMANIGIYRCSCTCKSSIRTSFVYILGNCRKVFRGGNA